MSLFLKLKIKPTPKSLKARHCESPPLKNGAQCDDDREKDCFPDLHRERPFRYASFAMMVRVE